MKSFLLRFLTAGFLALPGVASAQSGPVIVELFTSQGCSSCPPADDYLADLLGREDVLPLAFHVDYWDRLGWKDTFGAPEFTARQYAYGKAFNNRSVWTPQFVVGGVAYSRGSFRDIVPETIRELRSQAPQVKLSATQTGGNVEISAEPLAAGLPAMLVSLVGYAPKETVKIKRGENAGRTITYHNIVRSWTDVGRWNGRNTTSLSAATSGDMPFAVIVQAENNGRVLAVAHVR